MNKKLKIAFISNLIIGILFTLSIFFLLFGIINIVSAIRIYKINKSEIVNNKKELLVWGIINIFTNLLSSIMILLVHDDVENIEKTQTLINEPKKIKKPMSEEEKLDLTLKVGVSLIVLSAIVFLSSNYNVINDITKTIILFCLSLLFLGAYQLSVIKIKIEKLFKPFHILFFVFLSFTYLSIGFYDLLGKYFSLNGEGIHLFLSSFYTINMVLYYVLHKKYKLSIYPLYALFNVTLITLLYHFEFKFNIILLLTVLLNNLIAKALDSNKNINKYNKILNYVFIIITFILIPVYNKDIIINSIISLLSVLILIESIIRDKKHKLIISLNAILLPIVIILLPISLDLALNVKLIISSLLIFIFYVFNIGFKNKTYNNINYLTSFTVLLILNFASYNNLIFLPILISLVIISLYLIKKIIIKKDNYTGLITNPITIFISLTSILYFIDKIIDIHKYVFNFNVLILSLVFILLTEITKNIILKKVYFWLSTVLLTLNLFVSTLYYLSNSTLYDGFVMFNYNVYAIISSILICLYILINHRSVIAKGKFYEKFTFIFSNLILYFQMYEVSNKTTSSLPLYGLLLFGLFNVAYFKNNKKFNVISNILLVIPLYMLITYYNHNSIVSVILFRTLMLYVLYMITTYLIKDDKAKQLTTILGISFVVIITVFISSIEVAIFLGLLSVALIMISLLNNKYEYLFKLSFSILILNFMYQFGNFWSNLSAWIYLLLSGIVMILVVIYKLLKK